MMSNELSENEINCIIDYFGTKNQKALYSGCIASDESPSFEPSTAKFYIVNLGTRNSGGTHWTLLYNCSDDCVIYFDSMDGPPSDLILKFMNKTKKSKIINNQQFQN